MTTKEFQEILDRVEVDKENISKLEMTYKKTFTEQLQKIVSVEKEGIFFDNKDNWRLLSFDEILKATDELHVDFVTLGLLPIMDCGENDFIVFHFEDCKWSKFNIVDETVFKVKANLSELL
jgi:hypothetical protein